MRFTSVSTLMIACSLLMACESARRSEPLVGAFVPASAEVERGQLLFARHCNQCHTGGEAALGPALNDKPLPASLLRLQVRQGLGAMPAFDATEISDRELDELIAYVQALREHGS